jgi:low affinity Fe/Cu permease
VPTKTAGPAKRSCVSEPNAQNRDFAALQWKLDELIKSTNSPNDVIGIEEKPEPGLQSKRDKVASK